MVKGNPVREAHRLAMEAKHIIFRAQDAADSIPLPSPATGRSASAGLRRVKTLRERMRRDLGRARAALESLDRAVLDLGQLGEYVLPEERGEPR